MAKKIIDTAEWDRFVSENTESLDMSDHYDRGFADGLGVAEMFIDPLPISGDPRWIPVTERLPERAGDYLCVCDDGEEPYVVIIQYNDEQEAFGHEVVVYDPDSLGFVETEFEKWSVTHWQLLPEPPEVNDHA